ncbi:unnamed protein product [Owenia fusiformis]|uniref:Thymidylate kinase n=1 Tax=Owenia fusiformis TaxID=6347 RepID=A0A8J1UG58_OWEFU|nr:unnamed protein product [Owenia fusiformis]
MLHKMTRGALIVFEGCDRCGKTTQCKKLVDALNRDGGKAEFMRFPERSTAIGQTISGYLEKKSELEDHAVHLLFSANRWELVPKMLRLLNSGTTLIVDRYAYSGVAFTGAKPGFDLQWCKQPDVGLPKPDQVLYLTLSPEEASKRAAFGTERYENTEFQERVAKNFEILKEHDWKIVNAGKSIEDLHGEIKSIVTQTVESSKDKPILKLWSNPSEYPNKKRPLEEVTNEEGENVPV